MGFSIPGADALGKAFDWGQDLVSDAVGQVGDVIDTASNAIDTATAVGGAVRDTVSTASSAASTSHPMRSAPWSRPTASTAS